MINAIKYYYNISVSNLIQKESDYYFENYILKSYYKNIDIELYNHLIANGYYLHKIIYNKDNEYITYISNKPFVLLQINDNKIIDLNYIKNYNIFFNNKNNPNWNILWENKIDYYEKNIENIKDNKIYNSFNYFVGIAEIANSLYKNLKPNNNYCLCHIRFYSNIDFFDPFNLVIDYKMRDIAEFIKKELYQKSKYYYKEIDEIVNYNNYDNVMLFFIRMLYPSIYFDQYDNYIRKENIDYSFYDKKNDYEKYLKYIYCKIKNKYHISIIEWLE